MYDYGMEMGDIGSSYGGMMSGGNMGLPLGILAAA